MTKAQLIARACRIAIATPVIGYIIARFAWELARMSPKEREDVIGELMFIFKVDHD